VVLAGVTIADSTPALRVLETSHPPNYYLPPGDVDHDHLRASDRRSFCEFKGLAHYWSVAAGDRVEEDAAWSYPQPNPGYEALADHVAFYAARMDEYWVGDEAGHAPARRLLRWLGHVLGHGPVQRWVRLHGLVTHL
jgi:uncharacterized protein (DUF427 family)